LSDEQRERIAQHLPGKVGDPGRGSQSLISSSSAYNFVPCEQAPRTRSRRLRYFDAFRAAKWKVWPPHVGKEKRQRSAALMPRANKPFANIRSNALATIVDCDNLCAKRDSTDFNFQC
jgi:hypothetical protein